MLKEYTNWKTFLGRLPRTLHLSLRPSDDFFLIEKLVGSLCTFVITMGEGER